jgi:hypothetical protein
MAKISKQALKQVISPVLFTIFWNLLVIYLFVNSDKELFNDFVNDFGLNGNWNLFTLDMHANINGTLKTYPYINGNLLIFLMCAIGNIFLSAIYMARIYRANQKLSIPPPPPQN